MGPNVRRASIRQVEEDSINKRKGKRRNLDFEFIKTLGIHQAYLLEILVNKVNGFAGIFRGFYQQRSGRSTVDVGQKRGKKTLTLAF